MPWSVSTYAGGAPPPTPAPALSASLGNPLGVATDGAGNIYFMSLNCVFKIPSAVSTGPAVSLVLSINGVASNSVTIAVQ